MHNNSCYISLLKLANYRNHQEISITLDNANPVVIYGHNGLGKTNILEAISFMSPGRGFRNANHNELMTHSSTNHTTSNNYPTSNNVWSIYSEMYSLDDTISVGMSAAINASGKYSKLVKLDGKNSSILSLVKYANIIWLVPQMDNNLVSLSSTRRKFLDRFILNFDDSHAKRISMYENLTRNRMKILKKQ